MRFVRFSCGLSDSRAVCPILVRFVRFSCGLSDSHCFNILSLSCIYPLMSVRPALWTVNYRTGNRVSWTSTICAFCNRSTNVLFVSYTVSNIRFVRTYVNWPFFVRYLLGTYVLLTTSASTFTASKTTKIFYWPFQGGTSFVDLLCFCSVLCLLCLCARLFICALWSPAGKGLTSWLSFVVSTVSLSLSHWYPGSGVVLDCIDSWSLHTYLLPSPDKHFLHFFLSVRRPLPLSVKCVTARLNWLDTCINMCSTKVRKENSLFFMYWANLNRLNYEALAKIFESRHETSNNVVCATNKGSGQPAYTRSLTSAFSKRLNNL